MKLIGFIRTQIIKIIDWSYKPFGRFIPLQTFRYAFCGGANTAFDIFLYFLSYNYILQKNLVHLRFLTIKPHIAAFLMTFPITFTTGFLLSKYITFTESELKGRTQLIRYGFTVVVCIFLNYIFLKLFVEYFDIFPTPSKILTTCLIVVYSYFSQKYFSFKIEAKTALVND